MSLRGEMNDFLKAYTSVSGVLQKQNDSAVKSKYYDALIDQGKQKIGLQQQSLALRAQQLRNSNSIAGGRLGEMRRHNQAMEGIAGNRNKAVDITGLPPGADGSDSSYKFGGPDSTGTSGVTAPPDTPPTVSPSNVSLSNPEGSAYAEPDVGDPGDEEDGDVEDFAQGGAIGYAGGGMLDPGLSKIQPPAMPTNRPMPMRQAAPAAPMRSNVPANATEAVPTHGPTYNPNPPAAAPSQPNNPWNDLAYGIVAGNPAIQKLEGGIPSYNSLFGAEGGEVPEDANESAYDTGKKAQRDPNTDANESAYDTGKKAERKPEEKSESPYQNPTEDANEAAYDDGSGRAKEDSGYLQGSKGAVDTEESPESDTTGVTPAPSGGGTKTDSGFDQAAVLQRWGVSPDTSPIHLGLLGIADAERAKGGAGAVSAGPSTPTPIGHGVDEPTRKELHMADRIADPDGQLTRSSRNIARLDLWTNYFMQNGQPDRAKKVAAGLLYSASKDAQMYGDAAAKALQSGHHDAAADMLKHAYGELPNGHDWDIKAQPDGNFHAFDIGPDGTRQDLGVFGPQQVYQLATGISRGGQFWQSLVQLGSGMRAQQQKPSKPDSLPKAPNYTEQEKVGTAMQGVGMDKEGKDTSGIPGGYRPDVEASATAIHAANPTIAPQHAMAWANSISNPEEAESAGAVKLQPSPTNPNIYIATNQAGQQIKMDRNTALGLIAMRKNRGGDIYRAGAKTAEEAGENVRQGAVETEDRENKSSALKSLNRAKAVKRGENPDEEYDPNAEKNKTQAVGPM